jgi:hypothetical protein
MRKGHLKRMKIPSAIKSLVAVLCLCAKVNSAGHAQGNVILNGSFADGGGSYTNWNVSWNNLMFAGGPWITPGGPNSNFNYYAGQSVGYETSLGLSQSVATTPGTIYAVSFWGLADYDAQYPGYLGFNVNFGNSGVGVTVQGWYEYHFVTTAINTTTIFRAGATADIGSVYGITGISITETPEPRGLALAALGTLLLGLGCKQKLVLGV